VRRERRLRELHGAGAAGLPGTAGKCRGRAEHAERAERPLVIVGKGMAWSRAEDEERAFIERTQIPLLRLPMGKGVMPNDYSLSVAAVRTLALGQNSLASIVRLTPPVTGLLGEGRPRAFLALPLML
jgi:Thiamine pyrophosphate enzyme, central domain